MLRPGELCAAHRGLGLRRRPRGMPGWSGEAPIAAARARFGDRDHRRGDRRSPPGRSHPAGPRAAARRDRPAAPPEPLLPRASGPASSANPAATLASSSAAKATASAAASSTRARRRSRILASIGLHRTPPSAWLRLGADLVPALDSVRPSTRCDLGVAEAGEELQRDQLPLAGVESPPSAAATASRRSLRSTGCSASIPARSTGSSTSALWRFRRRSSSRAALRAIPNSQAAGAAAARVESRAVAVGALEGGRGHLLGGAAVAKQPGGVGIDVVATAPVEPLE